MTTTDDVIKVAASIARSAAEGRLSPAVLEQQAVTECRELFGTVAGPDDPLWPLQIDIARQVLALDGVPADELAEWLAVSRRRAGEPVSERDPAELLREPTPLDSEAADAEPGEQPEPVADTEPDPVPDIVLTPQRRSGCYDPLAGWSPGHSGR